MRVLFRILFFGMRLMVKIPSATENSIATAAINGWPPGILGSIFAEDRMHEPKNSSQANSASIVHLPGRER